MVDENNGNKFWRYSIKKYIHNASVAFDILDEYDASAPMGWKKVTGHIVFDVKMYLTSRSIQVLDGHKTPDTIGSAYTCAVSSESDRIVFTYSGLNGLDICAVDIINAYLQAPYLKN